MKRPKYTDDHRYPNGYKPAIDTDIRKTFDRLQRRDTANAKEAEQKVEQLPTSKRKTA